MKAILFYLFIFGQFNIGIQTEPTLVNFNGKGDFRYIDNIAIAQGSNRLEAASDDFTPQDVGKSIIIHGAGPYGDELRSVIKRYISGGALEIENVSEYGVSGAKGGIGTNNSPILQSMIASNLQIDFDSNGHYYFANPIRIHQINNLVLSGKRAKFYWISSNPKSYKLGKNFKPDLIGISSSEQVIIEGISGYNVGQTQSRINKKDEGNYYDSLNSVAVVYNRHFNRTSNTGHLVITSQSRGVIIQHNEVFGTGGLLSHKNSFGEIVRNNRVIGFGNAAIMPSQGSSVLDNYIDNTVSPYVNEKEDRQGLGSSSGIYVTSGFDNILIKGNKFVGIKRNAVQFYTNTGKKTYNNQIVDNEFLNCNRSVVIGGSSRSEQEVAISRNIFKNSGPVMVLNGNVEISNNRFDGLNHSVRSKYAIVLSGYDEVIIKDNIFENINSPFSKNSCEVIHYRESGNLLESGNNNLRIREIVSKKKEPNR